MRKTRKYHHLAAMHAALREVETVLLEGKRPALPVEGDRSPIFIYGEGAEEVAFLCNDDSKAPKQIRYRETEFTLAPLSVKLLRGGGVLFDTHELPETQPKPEFWPVFPKSLAWQAARMAEPLPAAWPAETGPGICVAAPEQQLPHTRDRSDYCWYETEFEVAESEAGDGLLLLTRAADFIQVFIDGVRSFAGPVPLVEERGDPDADSDAYTVRVPLRLAPGRRHLSILCAALGLIKGDWMLGKRNMIYERKGLWGAVTWCGRTLPGPWTIRPGLLGEQLGVGTAVALPPGGWMSSCERAVVTEGLRWWRTEFERPAEQGPYALDLTGLGKGLVWLNGQPLTRYWLLAAETAKTPEIFLNWIVEDRTPGPTQRYYRIPAWMLQDHNELVLIEELDNTPEQVCVVRVS